jgi:beta-N-acetylhexosaminidase
MKPAELTREATSWATELKAAGVNVNLAPVTDTVPKEIGKANEPIGRWGRQYGSTPEAVSRSATAFLEGMLDGGIEGTVKHFPGLGRVRNNTDFSSTGITDSVATTKDPFLQPFADGIEAGAGLVMMASARYPQARQGQPRDVLGEDRHGAAARADGLRGRRHHRRRQRAGPGRVPVGDRAVRHVAAGGDIVLTGAASDADEMLEALAARRRRMPGSRRRSTPRSCGCSPSRSGWACCPARRRSPDRTAEGTEPTGGVEASRG